jgi:hypothetical protein
MRNVWIVLLLNIAAVNAVSGQLNGVSLNGTKWPSQVFMSDVNGKPFDNRLSDISGSPYLTDKYKVSDITLRQGRKFVRIQAKINLVSQEVIFISANGVEGYMEPGMVRDIAFADTASDGNIAAYLFRSGYPAVDKQTDVHFYQVLEEGNCSLLRSLTKKVNERKNELSGEVSKEFETTENLYLFMKGAMKRIKKDRNFFLTELQDKQKPISVFADTEKLNFRNTEHLIRLVKYYNSLQ